MMETSGPDSEFHQIFAVPDNRIENLQNFTRFNLVDESVNYYASTTALNG
jgi:hypothetical protein